VNITISLPPPTPIQAQQLERLVEPYNGTHPDYPAEWRDDHNEKVLLFGGLPTLELVEDVQKFADAHGIEVEVEWQTTITPPKP
jgi:hypothetical protein